MEGLIPLVYKAIVHYANGGQAPSSSSWFDEPPPASYMRLPGDSGRFQPSEKQFFSSSSSSTSAAPASAATQQSLIQDHKGDQLQHLGVRAAIVRPRHVD